MASGIYPLLLPLSVLTRHLSINGSTSSNKSSGGKVAKSGQQKDKARCGQQNKDKECSVGAQSMTSGQWHLSTPPSSLCCNMASLNQWFNFLKPIYWWKSCKVWATKAHDKECRSSILDQWTVASIHSSFFSLPTRNQ